MDATGCVSVVAPGRSALSQARTDPASFFPELDRKFNPNQPRVAAGNPDGGQWTDGSVGVVDALEASDDWYGIFLRKRRSSG
ncbi:MAG: hypothetical protein BGP05_06125 [Rhizobiales bacterium 62-47]|jgi:hypothetical protein|nr:hypothetical protein [Hyphomicrobiales bacterium]OJY08445.1 MAG: hypothetical protein BGP05_06125 [Rhizobiales bacterium 62-47]